MTLVSSPDTAYLLGLFKSELSITTSEEDENLTLILETAKWWVFLYREEFTPYSAETILAAAHQFRQDQANGIALPSYDHRIAAALAVKEDLLVLLKNHLNIDPANTDDDQLLALKIYAAEKWVANHTGHESTGPEPDIIQATLMLAAHWYENREAIVVGDSAKPVPFGVRELLSSHRESVTGYVAA